MVLGLTVSFTVATAAFGIFNVSLPQLFESQLGQPDAYGYALAMLGVGFLCSELLTGFMQRESVARRSIFLSFLTTAGLMFMISHSTVTATAFLMLFLVGATDGITEVVYDTLIQLHVRRDLRAGVFAVAESVQNLGMVAGMAAAPVLVSLYSAGRAVQIAAVGCAGGARARGRRADPTVERQRPAVRPRPRARWRPTGRRSVARPGRRYRHRHCRRGASRPSGRRWCRSWPVLAAAPSRRQRPTPTPHGSWPRSR